MVVGRKEDGVANHRKFFHPQISMPVFLMAWTTGWVEETESIAKPVESGSDVDHQVMEGMNA